jgi:hypothetical protein
MHLQLLLLLLRLMGCVRLRFERLRVIHPTIIVGIGRRRR